MPYEPSPLKVLSEMSKTVTGPLSGVIRSTRNATKSASHLPNYLTQLYDNIPSLGRYVTKTIIHMPRGILDFHLVPGRLVPQLILNPSEETIREINHNYEKLSKEENLGRALGCGGTFLAYFLGTVLPLSSYGNYSNTDATVLTIPLATLLVPALPLASNLIAGVSEGYRLTKVKLARRHPNSNQATQ